MKLLFRLSAMALVGASLYLARGTAHDRVLLVVLEGSRLEEVRRLARAGHLPMLEAVVAGGVGGEIPSASEARSTEAILQVITDVPVAGTAVSEFAPGSLWVELERLARPYVLIGVPGTEFRDDDLRLVLAGPNAGNGFLGANTGAVISRRTIERGPLPWPYADSTRRLQDVVANIGDAGESEWIEHSTAADDALEVGLFKVYALDGDTFYLTPIYRRYRRATEAPDSIYVADDPSAVRTTSRAGDYLPRHARSLAEARAAAAVRAAAARAWDLFVYVDRRLMFEGTPGDSDVAESLPEPLVGAYESLDEAVGRMLGAVGDRTATLVVGLTGARRVGGDPLGWFAVANVSGDLGSWGPVSSDDLAATLSYLLSFDPGSAHTPVGSITTRFPLRARFRIRPSRGDTSTSMPATASVLKQLDDRNASQ